MPLLQALEAFQEAVKLNPDSKEVALKIKSISRLVKHSSQGGSKPANGHTEANGKTAPGSTATAETSQVVGIFLCSLSI